MVNLGGLSTITAGNLACFPTLCLHRLQALPPWALIA